VDGAIDPASSGERAVGGVDDRGDIRGSDVGDFDL
jgi:hypothetical protein